MRRQIGWLAVIVLTQVATWVVGTTPAAAATPGKKSASPIPVDPETRKKIHAAFTRHVGAADTAYGLAEEALADALLTGTPAQVEKATADFKARGASVEAAKKAAAAELDPLGVSPAVRQQEWTAWLAQREAARSARK
jgi:hypothetical protein